MVVYPQINVAVVETRIAAPGAHHQQRRRLHPPAVAARRLARRQRRHQVVGEFARAAGLRLQQRLDQRVYRGRAHQDVALRGEMRSVTPARPVETLGGGWGGPGAPAPPKARPALGPPRGRRRPARRPRPPHRPPPPADPAPPAHSSYWPTTAWQSPLPRPVPTAPPP